MHLFRQFLKEFDKASHQFAEQAVTQFVLGIFAVIRHRCLGKGKGHIPGLDGKGGAVFLHGNLFFDGLGLGSKLLFKPLILAHPGSCRLASDNLLDPEENFDLGKLGLIKILFKAALLPAGIGNGGVGGFINNRAGRVGLGLGYGKIRSAHIHGLGRGFLC